MEKVLRFKKMEFTSPRPLNSVLFIIISGAIYGLILSQLGLFGSSFHVTVYTSLFIFIIPSLAYGIITNKAVKNFYKRRAFLLSLINQTLLFFVVLVAEPLPPLSLFFLGLIYGINILSFIASSSDKGIKSLLLPLLYIVPLVYAFCSNGIFVLNYVQAFSVVCVGIATWVSVLLVDYFLALNIPEMSAVSILSSFINEKPRKLEGGIPVSALIQAINFRGSKDFPVALPWLHPGPMGDLGGGSMSKKIIEELNSGGFGYFWHAPTSHEDNPTDPDTADDILEIVKGEGFDFSRRATKILKREEGEIKVYGQRFGENYLVFVDLRGVDDFEKSIFQDIRNLAEKKVFFVDVHNHPLLTGEKVLLKDDRRSQRLVETILDLLDSLEHEKDYDVKLGLGVSESLRSMALLEEVGGERYLFITLDQNGLSDGMGSSVRESVGDDFEEAIILTTDTHDKETILLGGGASHTDDVKEALTGAKRNIEKGEVGFLEDKMEDVEVMGKDAHILEASVSFLIYLFMLHIFIIYFSFFIWAVLI